MPIFRFFGRAISLAELLKVNENDQALCEWAKTARPNDVFGDCRCVGSAGRQAADGAINLRRVNVSLDPVSLDKLRTAGGPKRDISAGIRAAARLLPGD